MPGRGQVPGQPGAVAPSPLHTDLAGVPEAAHPPHRCPVPARVVEKLRVHVLPAPITAATCRPLWVPMPPITTRLIAAAVVAEPGWDEDEWLATWSGASAVTSQPIDPGAFPLLSEWALYFARRENTLAT
jgi:hypothetical protein